MAVRNCGKWMACNCDFIGGGHRQPHPGLGVPSPSGRGYLGLPEGHTTLASALAPRRSPRCRRSGSEAHRPAGATTASVGVAQTPRERRMRLRGRAISLRALSTAFISLNFGGRKSVKQAQWRGTILKKRTKMVRHPLPIQKYVRKGYNTPRSMRSTQIARRVIGTPSGSCGLSSGCRSTVVGNQPTAAGPDATEGAAGDRQGCPPVPLLIGILGLYGYAPSPCVTFRLVVAPLQGPGQSPVLPFACCVGLLLSVARCGRCSCWCRFRVRGAQWLVCWGCAECDMVCRLRVSGAQ